MTNITYWGDMLNAVNAYVAANYGTAGDRLHGPERRRHARRAHHPRRRPMPAAASSRSPSCTTTTRTATWPRARYVGYTQLATLIKQERLHNPTRTLLLSGGDNIQGDAMMYYFKSAPTGLRRRWHAAAAMRCKPHPLMAAMNAMSYDAMDLGNHEFNFGSDIFTGVLGQANFPILGANVSDTGAYGLAAAQGGQVSSRTSKRPSAAASRSPSWASATTASPTTSCPATSPA